MLPNEDNVMKLLSIASIVVAFLLTAATASGQQSKPPEAPPGAGNVPPNVSIPIPGPPGSGAPAPPGKPLPTPQAPGKCLPSQQCPPTASIQHQAVVYAAYQVQQFYQPACQPVCERPRKHGCFAGFFHRKQRGCEQTYPPNISIPVAFYQPQHSCPMCGR
jgi:hypothetical protein